MGRVGYWGFAAYLEAHVNVDGVLDAVLNNEDDKPSDEAVEVMKNWKRYLPKWTVYNNFKSHKYYPVEFKKIAFQWLLVCDKLKVFPRDIVLHLLGYIAEDFRNSE